MPDDVNGRITLAVLSNQLVNLQKSVDRLLETVAEDHDRIGRVENQIEDFIWFKRFLAGYAIAIIVALALALYAVTQVQQVHP